MSANDLGPPASRGWPQILLEQLRSGLAQQNAEKDRDQDCAQRDEHYSCAHSSAPAALPSANVAGYRGRLADLGLGRVRAPAPAGSQLVRSGSATAGRPAHSDSVASLVTKDTVPDQCGRRPDWTRSLRCGRGEVRRRASVGRVTAGGASNVATYYSSHAEAYQSRFAAALVPASEQLLRHLPLGMASTVLDLGTGVGSLVPAIHLAAPDAMVVAADRASGMVAFAPRTTARVVADAIQLPFADASFDVAVLAFMLFHVPDPVGALRAVRRVLRAGGSLGLTTWGQDRPATAVAVWVDILDQYSAPAGYSLLAQHELMDSVDKVVALLLDAGFENPAAQVLSWADRPSLDEFIDRHASLGVTGRRFALLDDPTKVEFLIDVRRHLEALRPEAFVDTSDVIVASASAP